MMLHILKKNQNHIPNSFAYKVLSSDNKLSKPVVLYKGKNAVHRNSVMDEHFNKNLVITAEDEARFQSSNKSWICDKLFDFGDKKVRDHCHVTGKYRDSTRWSCDVNLKLTKKVLVIFHNFLGVMTVI